MSHKSKINLGLLVLALSILVPLGCTHWLETRKFEPVNMPVSLKQGESHATDFETNLTETYFVHFYVDYGNYPTFEECPARTWTDIHWAVYRVSAGAAPKKQFLASSDDEVAPGWFTGGFTVRPGKYRLEWIVAHQAACLDAYRPRLTISADSEIYEQSVVLIQFASLFLGGAGVMLVLRGLGSLLLGFLKIGRPLRIFPDLLLTNVLPLRRHSPMPLIVNLPIFIPLWICILTILVIMFAAMLMTPLMPRGFLVHFDKVRPAVWEKSPWTETMSVYVEGPDGFYVNGKHVAKQDLAERLKEELGKRMSWTVYFEADETARLSDAEYAMNTIQHLGAKLVWLTPKTRAEMNQKVSN